MTNIPDDPSVVQPILKKIKMNFQTQITKDLQFRKSALRNLLKGYTQMRKQFDEALNKDLGFNSFMSSFTSHSIFQAEANSILSHFQSWVKRQSISTPVGKEQIYQGLGLASCSLIQQPLGVALIIAAWNVPIYSSILLVAYAIAAGNAVILKPSQLASFTSNCLNILFEKYMDLRFYRVVQGKIQVAKAITKLPFDVICFTGSTATGRLVAIQAAKNLVPCILQLGGKCPVIVDQTAKIQSAVMRILFGKFFLCGQACIGVDHVYVHESIKQAFKKILLKKVQQFYGNGQNLKQQGNYPKIINDFHVKRLVKLLKDDHKGQVLYGGSYQQSTRYIAPTIIWQPRKQALLMQQEIFGPILPIFTFESLDEVILEIKLRDKPLTVYHFTENKKYMKKVEFLTSSGSYVVNDTIFQMLNSQLPFGGVGKSGYGRYHGKKGLQAFSNPKSICQTMALNGYPLNIRFPPYTESKKKTINSFVKIGNMTYGQIMKWIIALVILITIICYAFTIVFQLKEQ